MTAQRERKVNVDALSQEQAEQIGFELGKKIGQICDQAADKCNKLAGIYGLKVIVNIQYVDLKTGKIIS